MKTLTAVAQLEDITLEVRSGIDTQGKPTYDAGVTIEGRVLRSDSVARAVLERQVGWVGEDVKTVATIWVNGTESPLPSHGDRVTCEDGLKGIIVERKEGRSVKGVLDHVRLKLSEE